MTGLKISTDRTTKFYLSAVDFFDLDVAKDSSNQPAGPGHFTMQVRLIHVVEWTHPHTDTWYRRLQVEGRRYKADGTLGARPATGTVHASDLPPAVWVAVRDQVPAELHPGGTR